MRRGLPALWAAQGMPQAIAAGDLLLALSTLAVGEIPVGGDLRWALARLLAQATADAARGQSLELDLRPRRLLGWDAYLRAVDGKAGALFALPVQGALALCRHERAAELAIPFRILGTLYQLRDDVLDLYGTGIEGGGNDLREGRVTALVVAHLECRPHDRDWLLAILDRPREGTGEAHLAMASRRFEESGALAAVVERVEKLADTVRQHPAWVHAPGLAPLACSVVEDLLGPVAELGYAA